MKITFERTVDANRLPYYQVYLKHNEIGGSIEIYDTDTPQEILFKIQDIIEEMNDLEGGCK